jgi:hypothetical protein
MSSTHAPDPKTESPEYVPEGMRMDLEQALCEGYAEQLEPGESITVAMRTGPDCAWLEARVGPPGRAFELELFAREVPGELFDGALGLLVDYLDGVLEEWLGKDREGFLPLDFEGRPFEDHIVFVRGELRDYAAEAAAERLLKGAPEA